MPHEQIARVLQYFRLAGQNDRRLWTVLLAVVLAVAMLVSWHANQAGNRVTLDNFFAAPMAKEGYSAFAHGSANAASSMAQASAGSSTVSTVSTAASGQGRMVIEQANLDVTLPDVTKAEAKLSGRAVGYGGFVESTAQSTGAGNAPVVMMTLRVPQADFSAFVQFARSLGVVTSFSQSGQDVTQQYSSLTGRTAELQSERAAYTRLYGKAQSMRDMLQIQQALAQVNSQIAALSAQMHSVRRSVELSTVFLTLSTSTFSSTASPPVVTAWDQMVATLGSSALSLLTMVAWTVPWLAVFFLVVLIARALIRRKQ